MGAGTILPWAIVGLVAGWLAHPVLEKRFGVAPVVGWLPPLLLFFLAILVGVTGTPIAPSAVNCRPRAAPL
ncbi:MAG: hypothetical protein R2734_03825 [Nocardioides sp.]